MNEFDWLRQMRQLREPLAPPPDLWCSIDSALGMPGSDHAAERPPDEIRPSRHERIWLMVASFAALALVGGSLAIHFLQAPTRAPLATVSQVVSPDWKPLDPRLAGAATQLDAARRELQQAIQQSPDSPALQRLLRRTEQQQSQLQQLAHEAG